MTVEEEKVLKDRILRLAEWVSFYRNQCSVYLTKIQELENEVDDYFWKEVTLEDEG